VAGLIPLCKATQLSVKLFAITVVTLAVSSVSAESFDDYLKRFDYNERTEMKIKSLEAIELYKMGEVEFVDIRFREEQASWGFPFMKQIPLNELPDRLNELDKNKTCYNLHLISNQRCSILPFLFALIPYFSNPIPLESLLGIPIEVPKLIVT
jgi:hypothetical protein